MANRINSNSWVQGAVTVSVTCLVIALAYGVAESAQAGFFSFEAILILALILPAISLPAIAFRIHAKAEQTTGEIIRSKQEQLDCVLQNMAQGICMFDDEQRLIVSNERYAKMYGLSPDLAKPGTHFRDILQYRLDNGMYAGSNPEAYIEERIAAVKERQSTAQIQQLSDGRFVSIRHSPLPGGGWLATHEDITEFKKAETALMESEARLRAIFDNAPFCVNLKDLQGRYLFANKNYEEWWGRPASDAVGKTNEELLGDGKRAKVSGDLENLVIETGETCENEISIRHPATGETAYRMLTKFPVKSPEGNLMAVGTFAVDITERKLAEDELIKHRDHLQDLVDSATKDLKFQAEELETALAREKELNELQRQFISMASHEFRTPLAIIDSTAQRLKKGCDAMSSGEVQKRTDKIRKAVNRMTQLMESTLTAARMEDGKVSFVVGDCNIASLLWDVCERQAEVSGANIIDCDVTGLPETIQADTGALEQIFTNLVGNAVKYSTEDPQVEVRAWTEDEDIIVSVSDNGVGIDAADMKRLGERFFRAKSSMGIAGTGIGLNLVKVLVELHEGSLDIQSEIGKGSTFTVRLPVAGPKNTELAGEGESVVAA